ncbi:hypothetical protein BDA96_02G403400 [Sorghum bicolor]|uniref:Uncharacterized protein n=2 Tax=Sorghum bicolor TaxID=4558 RepID=A0A921RTP9_SORBI|nr:hypothetical protein BDA96_02G403400 [Sorghum bicolor]OQU90306.1 hypothetical protein SORBI_3002G384150 [Sorghum bicolor]
MAPRVMRGPRPLPTWSGRQRKGAPRCSSGGSPSRAATFAGAAAVAPSSWQPHREPSFQWPVGHDSSAVVAKVVVDHSSASSSSGYCSPRDEVSTTSLQPPCMSSPSGCSPQQPGLATCVPDADGADAVVGASSDAHEKRMLSTDDVKSLSPAFKMEVAIEILFRLDLARKERILSDDELDLIIHLKSQLPCLEAEIGEVNAHGADVFVVVEEEEEEEEEEEPLSPSLKMTAALKIMFRLDLAREMRILSVDELDLYDDMKSILPRLEAEIGEDNADGADAVKEEEEDNADGAHAVEEEEEVVVEEEEEEEEPLSPALQKEVAIEILFHFDLARKKRTLSAGELDLIIFLKSQLARLEVEIGEVNDDDEEEEDEEDGEEEEPLSPALEMEYALKVMFRLDLAREMRTLSADELDLYDDMKSLLPRLEAEIREVAAAPSIALEDPPSCQPHAPSVALAGANAVPSPMVPGASTSINLSADLQLPERSVVTNTELSTQGPEAMPSALKSSAEPEPAVEDDEITEALYGHSARRRRLPIFRDICPE